METELTFKLKTQEEILAMLADLKQSGEEKIRGPQVAEIVASMLNEMAPFLHCALHDNPSAQNYLVYNFVNDNADLSFDVVLLKKGRSYPPKNMLEKIQNLDPDFMKETK